MFRTFLCSLLLCAVCATTERSRRHRSVCDILNAAKTPCVAAHSVTRALYKDYNGPIYSVKRSSDNKTMHISVLANGIADTASQDRFCGSADCTIEEIYDQSPRANHLRLAPAGGYSKTPDKGVNATRAPTMINGHKVYAAFFEGDMGYRNDNTNGIATGDESETMYMVTSGRHFNGGCCFDYGNAETNNDDTGAGSMEAIYFGNSTVWGHGQGTGPWIMADLENGLWAGNVTAGKGSAIDADFVTAMVKGDRGNHFALKGGDAGGNRLTGRLKVLYDGVRPQGYHPMKKQGAIILGIGGDNSDSAIGTFYEGVMTQGYTTDATDDAVQANINRAGYGKKWEN